jgi:hypothetical protein
MDENDWPFGELDTGVLPTVGFEYRAENLNPYLNSYLNSLRRVRSTLTPTELLLLAEPQPC